MTAPDNRVSVAVLGSGAGSNAAALIDHSLKEGSSYRVDLVIATRGDAGIVSVAGARHIPAVVLPADGWQDA
ncbi:MAG: phosphoribosylglycinamide formyltransferase, partial [Candidatus Kapaibacterium sp.]